MPHLESSPGSVTYVIIFTVHPDKQDEFLGLLEPVLDAMRNEATFANAFLHRDPSSDYRYMLYETWTDEKDVAEVQIHREYRQAFWLALPELLESPREIQTWQPVRSDVRQPNPLSAKPDCAYD